jgi:hypothetical protein
LAYRRLEDGSVGNWDFETERCVTTLLPTVDAQYAEYMRVSMVPNRCSVVHFVASDPDILDIGGLHVWG